MIKYLQHHLKEVYQTTKLIDVEERFDIYFSRFFGLYFARLGRYIGATPTHVSLVSLFTGVAGGAMLYHQDQWMMTVAGSLLITLAGVLDSADGQLARMTAQSSEQGRIIDGIIDNFVFIACYAAGAAYFFHDYGWWSVLLAGVAGYVNSAKSALYEFYKSEYLYLVGKSESGHIPLDTDDLKEKMRASSGIQKFLCWARVDYTQKQFNLSTRSSGFRAFLREKSGNPGFEDCYRKTQYPMLFWWAWIGGTNVHRTLIMLLSILGRMDVYFGIVIVSALPMLILNRVQKTADQKLEGCLQKS